LSATSPRRPRGDSATLLRAPGENGGILALPPLEEIGRLLEANRLRLEALEGAAGPLGRSWSDLRRQARRAAVAAARDYLARHGEPLPAETDETGLLLAGHQPELFHPGVWVKNFALAGLARAHGRTALNLVVDNDSVKSTALHVPVPAEDDRPPRLGSVPFDRWGGGAPYEERAVADAGLFDTFADRVRDLMRGWHFQPLLPDLWAEAVRRRKEGELLGESFAAARRGLERAWGCHNLEVPLSALCGTGPFAWFACHLLAELPRFRVLWNEAVHDYRVRNRLRSSNHPVPDLAAQDGWLEAPFWGWRPGQERRGHLFARPRNGRIELRAGSEPWPALPAPEAGREGETVAAWSALEGQGFKARSRALTTTLFARLFLADMFLHGIGGGKYDELTDELIRRFYGVEPPGFVVLSATLWLPLGPPPAADLAGERRRLATAVRDLYWNPQRHLDEAGAQREAATAALAAEKAEWMARQPPTPAERRRRFQVLRELNERLRRPLEPRAEALAQELARCNRRLEAEAVLRRRDYSLCLYPAATLRPFCEQFLHLRA
jgi:hypothetical protein